MGFNDIFNKFKTGLSRTRESFAGKVQNIISSKSTIDSSVLDELEEVLIGSDVGITTTEKIIENIRKRVKEEKYESSSELTNLLRDEIAQALASGKDNVLSGLAISPEIRPYVIMVVGVNGVGKTTTIGKLAHKFQTDGLRVVIGAADTFRAAANEQLEIWAKRAEVELIQQKHGADPASVAYDTIAASKARNADVVIIDTAGRLHTKTNLMEELKKIKRVMEKQLTGAPHEVLLVLDATTGQNGLQQAKQFTDSAGVTGIVLTKLDGTAKGGIVLAISQELSIPVRYIGVGEKLDDLQPFDRKAFVDALFAQNGSSPQ